MADLEGYEKGLNHIIGELNSDRYSDRITEGKNPFQSQFEQYVVPGRR
jgi:hypothetical protein